MRIIENQMAFDADAHAISMSRFGMGLVSREITCVDGSYPYEIAQSTIPQFTTLREALLEVQEATRERDEQIQSDCFFDNK